MEIPRKGYGTLRVGRHSSPESDYFLTICLKRPSAALGENKLRHSCLGEIHRLEEEHQWKVRCSSVMPDHLHLVITLGMTGSLSATIRTLKGRLTPVLRKHGAQWQPNFYDHRLRPDEDRLPVFLYIFLNPFRKNLILVNQKMAGILLRRGGLELVWSSH